MAILNKYKRWVPMLIPIKDEYWDFVLSQDDSPSLDVNGKLTKKCLSSYIDFGDKNLHTPNGIASYSQYSWENCKNEGVLLENIGLTGIDNGLIDYGGFDNVTNKEFYDIFTNSKISIEPFDCRLYLHKITGNTGVYSYENKYVDDGYYALNGGFFQGFYKLFGYKYEILPQYIEKEWNIEIELRPREYQEKNNTLNSTHPNNKGIFFYIGTRSEDKFVRLYNCDLTKYKKRQQPERFQCEGDYFSKEDMPGEENKKYITSNAKMLISFLNSYGYDWNSCCSCEIRKKINGENNEISGCDKYLVDPDYYETDIKIIDKEIYTANEIPVNDSGYYEIKTDNKFLTFNRTKYGFTTANWDEDTMVVLTGSTNDLRNENLYLLMNRTKSGYTTETIDEYCKKLKKFNITSDTISNSFALKYNEDGSIGYRYFVQDCENDSHYAVIEETSFPGLIKENEWATINAKFSILNGTTNECGIPNGKRKMKIFIYVNGMLKFVSKELPEFNFRELNTVSEKQEGVPFNISIGGGTQGLCDSVWLNYNKAFEWILPIEEHFAGTFIGDIRSFKFYTCKLQSSEIKNNALYNAKTKQI